MADDMKNEKSCESVAALGPTDSGLPVSGEVLPTGDHLQRRLGNRQIQFITIGGAIGTALFINIGQGLGKGGPLGLLLAMLVYCTFVGCVNNGVAEMTTLMPVSGGFVRMAGYWVDDAVGFMVGWNYFLYEAISIPFEITAISVVLKFWRDDIPPAAVTTVIIVLYVASNVLVVSFYGEAEFWLAIGKVLLVFVLFGFTFFTMVGVNPQHDAYGFRYWKDPGPLAAWHTTGGLGRFEGFLHALWINSLIVCGPEFLTMVAGEAKLPRTYVKTAFQTMYWRFALFFIGGALATGIVLPSNDPTLREVLAGNKSGAAASPYVIAMQNMGLTVLPDFVSALLITSIFSAGNTYTYTGSRSLYGMALAGRAPRFLTRCTRSGVPVYCVLCTAAFSALAYLQLSHGSSVVLQWLVNLITGGAIIDYVVISLTYVRFHRACAVQGVDRRTFPYYGYGQPYLGWAGLVFHVFVLVFYGYDSFTPWDITTFFSDYAMVIVAVLTYGGWKLVKKTRLIPPHEVDLVWERPLVDAYEATTDEKPVGFWYEVLEMFGYQRVRKMLSAA